MKPNRKNCVGVNVRRYRIHSGLSQGELAARCQRHGWDIDRFTIARIEAGSRWVGDFEAVSLSRALRVTIARLFASLP